MSGWVYHVGVEVLGVVMVGVRGLGVEFPGAIQ